MLTDLSIRDIVLIRTLHMSFSYGLSVLTGETGAGKSILLDSLGLALGRRSDAKLVRPGAEKAVVTATFNLPVTHTVYQILNDHDLPVEDNLILRRTISADGRSKAYVNDAPVGITLLKQVGESLIEVQGQFDQHGLLNSATHILLLDAYAGLDAARAEVAHLYQQWGTARQALEGAKAEAEKARADEEYLRFAANELDQLAPQIGEEQELAERRSLLQNAERLTEAIRDASDHLSGAKGADSALQKAQKALDRAVEKMGNTLENAIAGLDRASVEIEEVIAELNRVGSGLQTDSGSLEDVEERLFTLREIARKHGKPVEELSRLREEFAEKLTLIDAGEERLSALTQAAEIARTAYETAATALSRDRQDAAHELDQAVNRELPPLKLDRARFMTEITPLAPEKWGAAGCDRIGFSVTTNPGMPGGPLDKVASGGELSRFLLAIKVVLAEVSSVPTLVFDEVDAGIGGATAAAVGDRLGRLSKNLQLLVVTHSPQVAAKGAAHWRVAKTVGEEGQTSTRIDNLDPCHRREELARMLSGEEITNEARAAADRLLDTSHR